MWLNENRSFFKITLHLLIWVLLLLFPYILASGSETIDFIRIIRFTWIPMIFYAVIFYSNYAYFIEKFLFTKKRILFFGLNICLILFFVWINYNVREFLNMISVIKYDTGIRKYSPPPQQLSIYKDIISMMIPIIFSIAAKTTENWSKVETEKNERETEMLNWELQHLKYQLQPHFFFNSLNTVYALIERSPQQAQETVHSLSKLMRYLLYDTDSGKTKLKDEITFMTEYINLMRLRISDKTKVIVDFPVVQEQCQVAPLLFISLIENAFKHGVSSIHPSELSFTLKSAGKKLRFNAENTNFPKTEKDKSGSGIGLVNLKKRLELLYPNRHKLYEKVEGQIFSVFLEIETD